MLKKRLRKEIIDGFFFIPFVSKEGPARMKRNIFSIFIQINNLLNESNLIHVNTFWSKIILTFWLRIEIHNLSTFTFTILLTSLRNRMPSTAMIIDCERVEESAN